MGLGIRTLTGDAITPHLDDLSRLRLTVFREWPYLYEGDVAYERAYLAGFAQCADAIVVAAFDGDQMIGAATAAPLSGHTAHFVPMFEARSYDPATVFYCGESVLLRPYRGQGLGHAFFEHRERHALGLNANGAHFKHAAFCGVVRDENDARHPASYRPLDAFWRKRGYQPVAGLTGRLGWREIGDTHETPHDMQFWMKALG